MRARESEASANPSFRRHVTSESEPASAFSQRTSDSTPVEPETQGRFRLYRLCSCDVCGGDGKIVERTPGGQIRRSLRCHECRGEGRVRELVATVPTPEAVGVAIVTLGREGEFAECPFGLLDTEGEIGQKWLIGPWLPSPRNVSDAGRLLQTQRKGKK